MVMVRPFRGLRPRPDLSAKIPSPPYDVLDSEEARALAGGDPHSFLHVVKPEIDLDPAISLYDDRVYAKARENLNAMIERGWLVRDAEPAYYLYRQVMGEHVQTGIVGAAAVDDYLEDRIKKHEHTRRAKEDDRTRHTETLSANAGPVFLTYRATAEIDALVEEATAPPAEVDFTAPDGVRHLLWVLDDPARRARLEELFDAVPCTYVADGHHRSASAARVGRERRERDRSPSGREAYNYFLAVHFPSDQLRILDYNRVVQDLAGRDGAGFLSAVEEAGFEVQEGFTARRPSRPGEFGLYLGGGRWYRLRARPEIVPQDDPVRRLDVAVLAEALLGPVLEIGDPRTDERIDFVGGIRGMDELERRVDERGWAAAFSLYPTSLDDLMAVADSGQVMPPKSTWFEPKLRSGLVVHLLDGEE
jgi:uncharacterized protein (DUF1015 family)